MAATGDRADTLHCGGRSVNMRTLFRIFLLAVTAACATRSPTDAPDLTHARRLPGVQGMDYAARVTPGLYRGAQPDGSGYRELRTLGVETVISFRRHTDTRREAKAAAASNFSSKRQPGKVFLGRGVCSC